MAISEKSKKRICYGNTALVLTLLVLTVGCWNEYSWYEVMAPLCTVITFLGLGVTFLFYVDIKEALRDKQFYLMVIADVITLINIVIVKAGIGSFFTVADVMLVLYLFDKIRFSDKLRNALALYVAFYFYYWTYDVKGYFKGYNTNYGGLILITGFVFAIMCINYYREKLMREGKKDGAIFLFGFMLFMIPWGFNIISWYRARCALIGFITFLGLMIFPKKTWGVKWLYNLLCYFATLGAIAISGIYIFLGSIKEKFSVQIFYKDILSGRDEIWTELWGELIKRPLTGIGSNYVIKLEWMGGIFEVHNGLLDILIVHGCLVFAIMIYIFIKKLKPLGKNAVNSNMVRIALSGVMAILVSSFMENFFIVPPFTLCFMLLLVIACDSRDGSF